MKFLEPIASKAGDPSVKIWGEPVKVDFRVISEDTYQLLINRIAELEEEVEKFSRVVKLK